MMSSPAPGPDPWRRGGGASRHRHGAVVFGGGSTGHTGAALAAGDVVSMGFSWDVSWDLFIYLMGYTR